jgi:predicted RNA polymerase sigma factor
MTCQPYTNVIDQAPFACVSSAWQACEGELRSYLRHRLSDDHAADDVLQDVFVKAMRYGQGFCILDNPRAWLFQVARNALVDRSRTAHATELPATKSRLLRARQRLRDRLTTACQVRFDADGSVAGHVPRTPVVRA